MIGFAPIERAESLQEFRDYSLYGLSLRSEIPLADAGRSPSGVADVTFSVAPRTWFAEATAGLRNLSSPDDWYERRRGADESDFLRFPELFEFMVSPNGRSVAFAQLEHSTGESFKTYLLGHVLSYALVKQGFEPLHATTVVVNGVAVALLGSSGQGKSTLAAAFLRAGDRILTDDLLLIREVDGILHGFSGPPRVKLYPDIAERFLPRQATSTPMNPNTRKLIIPLEPHQVHVGPAPIQRFVVLDECDPGSQDISLTGLSGNQSVLQLLASRFNTRLVTPQGLKRQFLSAREWAARIAVQRLAYPRALAEIDQVRESIVSDVRSTSRRLS